jgi:hypothetical protein
MKIFCVGRNYVEHAKELGNAVPDEPIIFMKPKSALLQTHTPFYYPEFTNELHYECELVLRVCKNGKYIQERFANKYYDSVSVGIDRKPKKKAYHGRSQKPGIILRLWVNGLLFRILKTKRILISACTKTRSWYKRVIQV